MHSACTQHFIWNFWMSCKAQANAFKYSVTCGVKRSNIYVWLNRSTAFLFLRRGGGVGVCSFSLMAPMQFFLGHARWLCGMPNALLSWSWVACIRSHFFRCSDHRTVQIWKFNCENSRGPSDRNFWGVVWNCFWLKGGYSAENVEGRKQSHYACWAGVETT